MREFVYYIASIFTLFILLNSCSTKKEWTSKANFIDFDNSRVTQVYSDEKTKDIIVTNPKGIAKYDENGNNLWIHESEGVLLKSIMSMRKSKKQGSGIKIGSVKTEMPKTFYLRKVFYLPLESGDFIEFNFDKLKHSLALIDGKSGNIKWELKEESIWNVEDFRIVSDEAFDLMNQLSSEKKPIIPVSEFVNKITENKIIEITETNRLIIDARNGLISLNLENGEIDWKMDKHRGNLQTLLYDEESKSIVAAYGYDIGSAVLGLASQLGVNPGINLSVQINKFLMRIDAKTGKVKWESEYDGNLRRKINGFGNIITDGVVDMRILNDVVMLNSLNIELFNFETGEKLPTQQIISDKVAKSLDLFMTNEAHTFTFSSRFFNTDVFPVENNNILYYVTNDYEIKNLNPVSTQAVRAYDTKNKRLLWQSEVFPLPDEFGKANTLSITEDYVVIGFPDGRGVILLDKNNGEHVWQYELKNTNRVLNLPQYSGVSAPFLIDGDLLYVAEYKTIHVLNLKEKIAVSKFSIRNQTGSVRQMEMTNQGLLVIGKHIFQTKNIVSENIRGLALFDKETYELIETISIKNAGKIVKGENIWVFAPIYPNQQILFINPDKFEIVGKKGKKKYRNALVSIPDEGTFYSVKTSADFPPKKGRLQKFSLKN